MRVTPWIDQFLRSKKAGSGSSDVQSEFGAVLVNSVHPTYAVIGDTQTEIHAVFSDDVRELVRLTLGGDLKALEKRHVRVLTAEPCFVQVRGKRKDAIMVDQVVVLDQGKSEAGSAQATTSEQPATNNNITFKSDARNLIKKVVTKLVVTPEKRVNRVEALLRDMKSRMGAALTTPTTAPKSEPVDAQRNGTEDTPKPGDPGSGTAVCQEVESTSATKTPTTRSKRLRSSTLTSQVSLRSGKCYVNGENAAEAPETPPPAPKRSRASMPSPEKADAEPTPEASTSTTTVASTSTSPPARPARPGRPSTRPTKPRGQPRATQRPPLWDISPPLLEAMRNLVHKHFSKWT